MRIQISIPDGNRKDAIFVWLHILPGLLLPSIWCWYCCCLWAPLYNQNQIFDAKQRRRKKNHEISSYRHVMTENICLACRCSFHYSAWLILQFNKPYIFTAFHHNYAFFCINFKLSEAKLRRQRHKMGNSRFIQKKAIKMKCVVYFVLKFRSRFDNIFRQYTLI